MNENCLLIQHSDIASHLSAEPISTQKPQTGVKTQTLSS